MIDHSLGNDEYMYKYENMKKKFLINHMFLGKPNLYDCVCVCVCVFKQPGLPFNRQRQMSHTRMQSVITCSSRLMEF